MEKMINDLNKDNAYPLDGQVCIEFGVVDKFTIIHYIPPGQLGVYIFNVDRNYSKNGWQHTIEIPAGTGWLKADMSSRVLSTIFRIITVKIKYVHI